MIYRLLADAVFSIHLAFVVFVVIGGFLALRWRRVVWLHIPTALWGAAIEIGGWTCPLTPLENWLLRRCGEAGYPGGFIEYYIAPIVYPAGLTRPIELLLGGCVILVNIVAYTLFWRASR